MLKLVYSSIALIFLAACDKESGSTLNSDVAPLDRCSALVGSCDYYTCIEEERVECGDNGYPLGYGQNYCEKLSALEFMPSKDRREQKVFPADGNVWKSEVRTCLQVEMEAFFRRAQKPSCQQLRSFAFDSHPRCYTGRVSFCELNVASVVKVGLAIAPDDLLASESLKQVKDTAGICVSQIDQRLGDEKDFLVRLKLLQYRTIWKAVSVSPSSLTAWLNRFLATGDEAVPLP